MRTEECVRECMYNSIIVCARVEHIEYQNGKRTHCALIRPEYETVQLT